MNDPGAVCPLRFADLQMAEDRGVGWRQLLDAGGVVNVDGMWVLANREAVEAGLKNPQGLSSRLGFKILGCPTDLIPAAVDQPEHARYRRLTDPYLGPKQVAILGPHLRARLEEIIGGLAEKGHCDIVPDLATPFPTEVLLALFGLPLSDRDQLQAWTELIVSGGDLGAGSPLEAAQQAGLELHQYLLDAVAERRRDLVNRPSSYVGEDFLTKILAEADENRLADHEIIGLGFNFVLAGLHTMKSAIGFFFYHLATHPELRRQIVEDPDIIPRAAEELLRLEVPAPFGPRMATTDLEVQGQQIPADSMVFISFGAANRDPAEHPHPDEIDFSRVGERNYAFGGGIHRCAGSHVARLQLKLVLEEFHKQIPNYQLAPGARPLVGWPTATGVIELDTVPLVFGSRTDPVRAFGG